MKDATSRTTDDFACRAFRNTCTRQPREEPRTTSFIEGRGGRLSRMGEENW